MKFPFVVCDGYCGYGVASSTTSEVPYFYIGMFSDNQSKYFQPEKYMKLEKKPVKQSLNAITSCVDTPSSKTLIEKIKIFQEDKNLQKVVLAKKRRYCFSEDLNPLEIASKLLHHFPDENTFIYMPDANTIFFGSTPENLYVRKGDAISVDCVAATALAGDEDSLFTTKHIKEHKFVTDFVTEAISLFTSSIEVSELSVKKAANLSHLHQIVSGTLKKGITDQEIIRALHPTPATLGFPRDKAVAFLNTHEEFNRGFYAGAIGWIHPDSSILKVAIRSAYACKNSITLFAGAGMTKESDPLKEVTEIDNKFKTLEEVFVEKTMSH